MKYRLFPNVTQEKALDTTLYLCRQLYNAALEERRGAYKKSGVSVRYYEQKRALTEIKADLPEYKGIHSQVLQDVIERLDKSFKGFFRRVKAKQTAGYPRFKGRNHYDSFTYPQAGKTGAMPLEDSGKVDLSKIGNVRCTFHRPLEGQVKTATVKREGDKWFIVFACEVEAAPLPATGDVIGIDLGTNPNFLITSDGEFVPAPRHFKKSERKIGLLQRAASKRKRGSRRHKALKRQVAAEHRRVANRRRDFHHKTARTLVNHHDTVFHEDLNIIGLARSRTAKGVLDAGWASFINILSLKAANAGRRVLGVDPKYTSQDCHQCGHRQKIKIGHAYLCANCGLDMHRDVHAALNILNRGRDAAFCESVQSPALADQRSLAL
ncbi:RNA-guided endonuclease InsQ/TnpB family protein [Deinococcus rubellus]|uniref:Transposase n=1 Tax=Deinococcus rubellus TaxID=1889240 RepID=A0ABY5YFZ0_9DEIO|nr:transposase [Deinococcus rubellus]UWX63307.1 transposase [Deinococcus rubellus]UWX63939.1 transposase [Deinococcus rubellus]